MRRHGVPVAVAVLPVLAAAPFSSPPSSGLGVCSGVCCSLMRATQMVAPNELLIKKPSAVAASPRGANRDAHGHASDTTTAPPASSRKGGRHGTQGSRES